jgi:hypothetical protein
MDGRHAFTAVTFMLLLSTAAVASAQTPEGVYRISQRAAVSQTLGKTEISLDYSRPLARGRTNLFGGVVHWGELWTPGANEASVLEVDTEIKLNGHTVPDGRWSMWIIPSRVGPWELVLDARDTLFHTNRPELTDDQIRFVVDVEHDADHVEVLTWTFPHVSRNAGTLQMNWGTTQIAIDVEAESNMPVLTIAAEEAARYVGEWEVVFGENPVSGEPMPPVTLTIRHADDGSLVGRYPPRAFPAPPGSSDSPADSATMTPQERERAEARRLVVQQSNEEWEFLLVPRAQGIFMLGLVEEGLLLEVEPVYHEFEVDGERAVSLTIRGAEDQVWATATRR